MAAVTLKGIGKRHGELQVLQDITLDIRSGEFIAILGPSGCGKTTLLRIIAGLETPSEGALEIDGQNVDDLPAPSRGVAMVFQSYALYPHMSVRDNLAFALRLGERSIDEIERKVGCAADSLQITAYLDRLPKQLSGGQRQRVAIARAIVCDPEVLLFDEPLSNLDAGSRVAMRIRIAALRDRLPDTTMVYVTHDQAEAMTLAERIVVLSTTGQVEQVGTPGELYSRPCNLFVARFIGWPAMNVLPATLVHAGHNSRLRLLTQSPFDAPLELPLWTPETHEGQQVQFGVRSQDLSIASDDNWLIQGRVVHVDAFGDLTHIYVDPGPVAGSESEGRLLVVKLPGALPLSQGETLRLAADLSRVHLFDRHGTALAHARAPREGNARRRTAGPTGRYRAPVRRGRALRPFPPPRRDA